jgi:hypothetical protein
VVNDKVRLVLAGEPKDLADFMKRAHHALEQWYLFREPGLKPLLGIVLPPDQTPLTQEAHRVSQRSRMGMRASLANKAKRAAFSGYLGTNVEVEQKATTRDQSGQKRNLILPPRKAIKDEEGRLTGDKFLSEQTSNRVLVNVPVRSQCFGKLPKLGSSQRVLELPGLARITRGSNAAEVSRTDNGYVQHSRYGRRACGLTGKRQSAQHDDFTSL